MCVIIHHQRKHETIPLEALQNAIYNNPHGVGLVTFRENGILNVVKELPKDLVNGPNAEELHKKLDSLKNLSYILHLRNTTVGANTVENLHPFELMKDEEKKQHAVLMHNGTLHGWNDPQNKETSDTFNFVNTVAAPLADMHLKAFPDKCIVNNPVITRTLEEFRGNTSRFILISSHRAVMRFGNWTEEKFGYASNTDYFTTVKRGPHQKKPEPYQGGIYQGQYNGSYESYSDRQKRLRDTFLEEGRFWTNSASSSIERTYVKQVYTIDHTFFYSAN